jgi:hypothetical protein
MEVSGQLHAPTALPLGKESPVPIQEEVGWIQEPVWMRWRRKKIPTHPPPPPGIEPPNLYPLDQWYSTGGTRTPGGTRRHLRWYVKFKISIYILFYE